MIEVDYASISWLALNELSTDTAGLTTLGDWTQTVNCTIASNTGSNDIFAGAYQLRATAIASAAISVATSGGGLAYPATPGQVIRGAVAVRNSLARGASIDFTFYDSLGNLITTIPGLAAVTAAFWRRVTATTTVPDNAAFVAMQLHVTNTLASEITNFAGPIMWTGDALPSSFVFLPNDPTAYIASVDSPLLSPTGDLDVQVEAMREDWLTGSGTLLSKWNSTSNQRSFRLYLNGAGKLAFEWSANGTTAITKTCTTNLVQTDGLRMWTRAVLDVDNGSGGNTVHFYQSSDGVSWVELGTPVVTAGVTSVFNSTAPIEIGSHNAGAVQLVNTGFYTARIYGSTNLTVPIANWSFSGLPIIVGATSTTDDYSNIMNITGGAFLSEWDIGFSDVFGAYLIERSDDGLDAANSTTAVWQTIAALNRINLHHFNDFEGRRNNWAAYRMRIIDDNEGYSNFTPQGYANPQLNECAYVLTTNEAPTLTLAYHDEPDRSYSFPDEYQEWEFYGRDFAVVFRDTENRGDVFDINFWLYMDGTPASNNVPASLRGRQAFQPMINLVRAPISYICVHDQDGNRWFAAITMDNKATRKEPGGKYLFPVRVRQTTDTPSTPFTQ